MSVTSYPSRGKRKALKLCRAFAQGCGGRLAPIGYAPLLPGPAFFYGWTEHTGPLIRQCQAEGRDWYYCDNAYYFGRPEYFRITRNALMLTGVQAGDRARWGVFGLDIAPWRQDGRHIVIATQSELHYQMHLGLTRDFWAAAVTRLLKLHTDREVVVCHKPEPPFPGGKPHGGFEAMLPGAWAVVSHTSSSMVKALLDGVPVFSLGDSMCSALGTADVSRIEDPPRPEGRRELMETLAANQWTRKEIRAGIAWRALQRVEPVAA